MVLRIGKDVEKKNRSQEAVWRRRRQQPVAADRSLVVALETRMRRAFLLPAS
jgi:hypothetical protein